jgi:hypothetical protein
MKRLPALALLGWFPPFYILGLPLMVVGEFLGAVASLGTAKSRSPKEVILWPTTLWQERRNAKLEAKWMKIQAKR